MRAYLLDANGVMLDRKFEPLGILKIPDNDFDAAFEETCAPWLGDGASDLPILASGMIGSRQGWLEAPYVPQVPFGLAIPPSEPGLSRNVRLSPPA